MVNLGCRTNAAEVDEMASLLAEATNVVVINSCTVTRAADRDTRKAVARARREHAGAAVVLVGCYVDAHPGEALGADLVVPNRWKAAPVGIDRVDPPGERRSRFVLKVQDGCDNRCTFCIVWQTRGRSVSRVLPYLEARARAVAEAGYREMVLTGIDLGSYRGGMAPLVRRLLDAAPGVRVRLSSIDPSHVTAEVAGLFADPRVCPHVHLPLQSGSDAVLGRMRRRYDVAGFRKAVELVRRARPDVALTGDVMAGFPGETPDDFERSLEEVERARFSGLHVFRYSTRPRTAAARYPEQVEREEGKERSRRMIELGNRLRREFERSLDGREVEVIWDRPVDGTIKGVSEHYLQVAEPAGARRPGDVERLVWRTA